MKLICLLAVGFLFFFVSCDEGGIERVSPIDITVEKPILDYGPMHNLILSEMDALGESKNWTREEYFQRLTDAGNRAYREYGASREFTVDEVEDLVVGIAYRIEESYDPTNRDPDRADPVKVLDRFLANGKITRGEYDQLAPMFLSGSSGSAKLGLQAIISAETAPVSDVVRQGASVFRASLNFWTGADPLAAPGIDTPLSDDGDNPPNKDRQLRVIWGDALGTVTAALLGAGAFAPLAGAALSTAFHMEEGCIACPEGGNNNDYTGATPPGPQP